MCAEVEQLTEQEREKGGEDEEIGWRIGNLQTEMELFKHTFQLVDEALSKVMGSPYWKPKNQSLVYLAFAEQKQLETDGARILFFQPPHNSPPEYWDVTSDEAEI